MEKKITSIVTMHSRTIAEAIYPSIPGGNGEISFIVGSEDGEYTETMDSYSIAFASGYFQKLIHSGDTVAICHASLKLASSEELRKKLSDIDADDYFDSDGHYERGTTIQTNRAKFFDLFPTAKDFRDFYKGKMKDMGGIF